MNSSDLKTAKLAAQWPKPHRHAAGFLADSVEITPEQWATLPLKYVHTDDFCTSEARDCACGSTLVVMSEIHDLAAE